MLLKNENMEVITLEFAPTRDHDGQYVAKQYRESFSDLELYNQQQIQLKKLKQIVESKKVSA